MKFAEVGTQAFIVLGVGALLAFVLPLGLALIWKFRKKEKFTTFLIGAVSFLLFAIILEKPIQALVISADSPVSRFLNANPVCWAFAVGLFPGVFEETGRFVAFKTLLKSRKNRETSVSYGIGHGGFEVMFILGGTYVTYITYALMINAGTFQTVIDKAPNQALALYALADRLAGLTAADVGLGFAERAFAVLFHIGASILVFYACKDKKKFRLYPIAILLHTALDFVAALAMIRVLELSTLALEGIVGAFGLLTFCGAYFLLYKKDNDSGSGAAGQ